MFPISGTTFANNGLRNIRAPESCFACGASEWNHNLQGDFVMKSNVRRAADRAGKIKYGLVAWLIGLPLPIIILALFWAGCDF